jgi:hypothetical protein
MGVILESRIKFQVISNAMDVFRLGSTGFVTSSFLFYHIPHDLMYGNNHEYVNAFLVVVLCNVSRLGHR